MDTHQADSPDRQGTEIGGEPTSTRARILYLLPVAGLPVAMLLAAFLIVPTRWFDLHSRSLYLANLGYGASLSGRDCSVHIS